MQEPAKKTAPKPSRATPSPAPKRAVAPSRTATTKPRTAAARTRVPGGTTKGATLAHGFELNHELIAVHAYDLFERSGHPHGRDVEFWLEAERQLKFRRLT